MTPLYHETTEKAKTDSTLSDWMRTLLQSKDVVIANNLPDDIVSPQEDLIRRLGADKGDKEEVLVHSTVGGPISSSPLNTH